MLIVTEIILPFSYQNSGGIYQLSKIPALPFVKGARKSIEKEGWIKLDYCGL